MNQISDFSLNFCFLTHVVIIVHKNSQLKQKWCQNDFVLLFRSYNKPFLFLKDGFLFSDISDPRLTQKVSCFDE